MKKITALILSVLMIFGAALPAFATDTAEDEITYFDDGSYLRETYTYEEIKWENVVYNDHEYVGGEEDAMGSVGNILLRILHWLKKILTNMKKASKSKYIYYYDANGTLLWQASIYAEFEYNGLWATCKVARKHFVRYDADWKLISSECDYEDATATAKFTVKQYKLGIPLKTINKKLTLTCDRKGNVT